MTARERREIHFIRGLNAQIALPGRNAPVAKCLLLLLIVVAVVPRATVNGQALSPRLVRTRPVRIRPYEKSRATRDIQRRYTRRVR